MIGFLVRVAAGLALVSCGGGASTLSGSDRASTAGVCATVSGDVATAVNVGVQVAAQSLTPAQAQTKLAPILTKVTTVAQQNTQLPIGPKLQHLADTITAAGKVDPSKPAEIRSVATDLGSAAQGIVSACADVAR